MNVQVSLGPRVQYTTKFAGNRIDPGTVLSSNNAWCPSPNQDFVLVFQKDGNLVLYQVMESKPALKEGGAFTGKPIWGPERLSRKENSTFEVQNDGNLVIYDSGRKDLWSSRTNGITPFGLCLQDNGNLVLYKSEMAWTFLSTLRDMARMKALVAATGTTQVTLGQPVNFTTRGSANVVAPGTEFSGGMWYAPPNQKLVLIFQKDGNLVLYEVVGNAPPLANGATFTGKPLWDTETFNHQNSAFVIQDDGNLVIYDSGRKPIWASSTRGIAPCGLYFQDDGLLVLYKAVPAWASNTTTHVRPEFWMKDLWRVIGDRRLCDITMAATHDSGVYKLIHVFPPLGTNDCNTRAQEIKIEDQLKQGARRFDIRVAIWGADSNWYLHHGTIKENHYFGAFGESFDAVLEKVREFASNSDHDNELIILEISHLLYVKPLLERDTDARVRYFTHSEKVDLRKKVQDALKDVMITSSDYFTRLADRTLKDLVSGGRTVLCLFEEGEMGGLLNPQEGIFSLGGPNGVEQNTKFPPAIAAGKKGQFCVAYVPKYAEHNEMRCVSSLAQGNDRFRPFSLHGGRSKTGIALATAPDGALYALYVADNETNRILLKRSEDGGISWSADIELTGQSTSCEPCLAAGKDGWLGAVYLGNNPSDRKSIYITTSNDGGKSWPLCKKIANHSASQPPALAVDPNGKLYLLYADVDDESSNPLMLATSTDGGNTWAEKVPLTLQNTKAKPGFAIDSAGNLHALYLANDDSNELYLTTSTDGGKNWSVKGIGQSSRMAPSLAIDSGDKFYAVYTANNDTGVVLLIRSDDHGKSWGGDQLISSPANLAITGGGEGSDDIKKVIEAQKKAFLNYSPMAGVMYGVSWNGTCEAIPGDSKTTFISPCIDKMAGELKERLRPCMDEWVREGLITPKKRPNFIGVDFYVSDTFMEVIEYLNRVNR